MRRSQSSLPLAFILAMASETCLSHVVVDAGENVKFEDGALRQLLDAAVDAEMVTRDIDQSGDRRLPGDKTAQFFPNFPNFPNFNNFNNFPNFFNCFNGLWRNC